MWTTIHSVDACVIPQESSVTFGINTPLSMLNILALIVITFGFGFCPVSWTFLDYFGWGFSILYQNYSYTKMLKNKM